MRHAGEHNNAGMKRDSVNSYSRTDRRRSYVIPILDRLSYGRTIQFESESIRAPTPAMWLAADRVFRRGSHCPNERVLQLPIIEMMSCTSDPSSCQGLL